MFFWVYATSSFQTKKIEKKNPNTNQRDANFSAGNFENIHVTKVETHKQNTRQQIKKQKANDIQIVENEENKQCRVSILRTYLRADS